MTLSFEAKEKNGDLLVEQAATALNSWFFLDCGEGRDIETDDIYLMDFSGWLVPNTRRKEFETTSDRHDSKWNDFFVFAEWRKDGNDIKIDFNKYPAYYD